MFIKLVSVTELDRVTPKQNTYLLNYDELRGKIFEETYPAEVGNFMRFNMVNSDNYPVRTSLVSSIMRVDNTYEVTTKNTVYEFEVL